MTPYRYFRAVLLTGDPEPTTTRIYYVNDWPEMQMDDLEHYLKARNVQMSIDDAYYPTTATLYYKDLDTLHNAFKSDEIL